MAPNTSQRIVSLVPSLTEFLFEIGLGNEVVGITRFCIHPEKALKECVVVGGTKDPNIQKIRALNPTLIVANKEENVEQHIRECEEFCEVIVTEISSIDSSFLELARIGEATDRTKETEELLNDGKSLLLDIPKYKPIHAAYFIWRKPWMVAGGDTFISDVLKTFHVNNVFSDIFRYPEISLSDVAGADVILLSSEPYAFKQKHERDFRDAGISAPVELVDGEWFSWYGSRFIRSIPAILEWRKNLGI